MSPMTYYVWDSVTLIYLFIFFFSPETVWYQPTQQMHQGRANHLSCQAGARDRPKLLGNSPDKYQASPTRQNDCSLSQVLIRYWLMTQGTGTLSSSECGFGVHCGTGQDGNWHILRGNDKVRKKYSITYGQHERIKAQHRAIPMVSSRRRYLLLQEIDIY